MLACLIWFYSCWFTNCRQNWVNLKITKIIVNDCLKFAPNSVCWHFLAEKVNAGYVHSRGNAAATVWDVHTREQSVPFYCLSPCSTRLSILFMSEYPRNTSAISALIYTQDIFTPPIGVVFNKHFTFYIKHSEEYWMC